MSAPITRTRNADVHQQADVSANTRTRRAASAGVASADTTVQSAAPAPTERSAETVGCCGKIQQWFSNCWSAIRDCLAKLPCIGKCFKREDIAVDDDTDVEDTQQVNRAADVDDDEDELTNDELIAKVQNIFPCPVPVVRQASVQQAPQAIQTPRNRDIDDLIADLTHRNAETKLQAFAQVLNSVNPPNADQARRFYNLLPEGVAVLQNGQPAPLAACKAQFRHNVWLNNNRQGNADYGVWMVNNDIFNARCKQAAADLATNLAQVRAANQQ
jgi:hypothetical protein